MAPEAPIPVENDWARRAKRIFPANPPRKNTVKKLLSPEARMRKLPMKNRLNILNNMWVKLPWTKILLIMVQGCCDSRVGVKPRKEMSELRAAMPPPVINSIMKIKTFRDIKNHRTFKLMER
jgi:hypothetical protein